MQDEFQTLGDGALDALDRLAKTISAAKGSNMETEVIDKPSSAEIEATSAKAGEIVVASERQGDTPAQGVVSEGVALLAMIERVASNPAVDVDKFERLMAMQERILARNARAAFIAAFAKMQPELPTIDRNGTIIITHKDDKDKPVELRRIIQKTKFATWEDISDAIKPILARNGFGLSFRIGGAPDGKVTVTGILSHIEGHQEETAMPALPYDTSGSKNNLQGIGSSISYGKRYAGIALLNITSRAKVDADDDGSVGGGDAAEDEQSGAISAEQVERLIQLGNESGANQGQFLAYFEIERIEDLPTSRYLEAEQLLRKKRSRRAGASAGAPAR